MVQMHAIALTDACQFLEPHKWQLHGYSMSARCGVSLPSCWNPLFDHLLQWKEHHGVVLPLRVHNKHEKHCTLHRQVSTHTCYWTWGPLKSIPFLLAGLSLGSDKLYKICHAIPTMTVTATLQHTNQPKLWNVYLLPCISVRPSSPYAYQYQIASSTVLWSIIWCTTSVQCTMTFSQESNAIPFK